MAPTPPAQAGAPRASPGCGAPAEPPRPALGRPRSRTNNVRLGGTKAAGLGLLNTSEARRAAQFIGLGEKIIKNPPKNKGGSRRGGGAELQGSISQSVFIRGWGRRDRAGDAPAAGAGLGAGGFSSCRRPCPRRGLRDPPRAGCRIGAFPKALGAGGSLPPLFSPFPAKKLWERPSMAPPNFPPRRPRAGIIIETPWSTPPAFPRARGSLRPTPRGGGALSLPTPLPAWGSSFGVPRPPRYCALSKKKPGRMRPFPAPRERGLIVALHEPSAGGHGVDTGAAHGPLCFASGDDHCATPAPGGWGGSPRPPFCQRLYPGAAGGAARGRVGACRRSCVGTRTRVTLAAGTPPPHPSRALLRAERRIFWGGDAQSWGIPASSPRYRMIKSCWMRLKPH